MATSCVISSLFAEASPGKNLELSLDLRLQYLAYRELKSAIQYYNAVVGFGGGARRGDGRDSGACQPAIL